MLFRCISQPTNGKKLYKLQGITFQIMKSNNFISDRLKNLKKINNIKKLRDCT